MEKTTVPVSHLDGANLSKITSWGYSPLMVAGSNMDMWISPADWNFPSGELSQCLPWRVNRQVHWAQAELSSYSNQLVIQRSFGLPAAGSAVLVLM